AALAARPVCGAVAGRALEHHGLARPLLEREIARLECLREDPTGEVRAAGVRGEHLRGGAAERAVPGDVTRERGCDERRALVRDPVGAEDPADAVPIPGPEGDLAEVTG